ncbi:myogenesis-regulating glycosidase-like [Dendronephthya gigantea]|uniref:myogenesis-regulating glycosidase-like n=1 Tax=Dendronephthya gigantea TaxID=151771 RepID=UPI00106A2292|nr:myogenesis-regulating glycosidase-like [Dendronephthya gigantea]
MAVAFTRSETPGTEAATLFYGNERDADTLSIKDDGIRTTEGRNRALFAWETRSLVRRRILQVVIGILGVILIVLIILAFKLRVSDSKHDNNVSYFGTARFSLKDKQIDFKNATDQYALTAQVGLKMTSNLTQTHSKSKYVAPDGVSLTLTQESNLTFAVNWTSSSNKPIVFMDCFVLAGSHWYGGAELYWQKWPMEKVQVNMMQYVPQSLPASHKESKATFGPVLERYWLSSNGIAIIVDKSVPLHVSINENNNGMLCLKSDPTGYLQPVVSYLAYRVLSGYNLRDLHLRVIRKFLGKPSVVPNEALIKKPSWIISSESDNISKDIADLEGKILKSYSCGNVVISGKNWEQFNSRVERKEINELRFSKLHCNVSMNVNPYLQITSKMFSEAAEKGNLLNDCGGEVPGLIKWRNSLSACIDLLQENATKWFKRKLVNLTKNNGIDSFGFYGGDVSHLPSCYNFHNTSMDPGRFSIEYANFAASMAGINVHIGHQTQTLPIFVGMKSKEPTWDGLRTLIPTLLTFGIMGYPYVLPSVIGGLHGDVDKELYIRWMQVSMFLPSVQFDRAPWDIGFNQSSQIIKNLFKKRKDLSPVIMDAFKNVTLTGAPIIRPLWWVAPTDPDALKNDSQFMLGDTYLVAPVLESKKTTMSVYLPAGCWKAQFNSYNVFGKKNIGISVNVDVSSWDTLVYYKRLELCK